MLFLASVQVSSQETAPAPPEFPTALPTKLASGSLPPFPPVVRLAGGKPWSAHLTAGWNLLAFPGLVQAQLGGLQYALIDASSGSQLNGCPQPWHAYWAYSENESIVSTALAPATVAPELTLQPGWNALSSPLRTATSVRQVDSGQSSDAPTYSQCYSGALGSFKAQPFQPGFTFEPSQVVWVYANRACSVSLGAQEQTGSLAAGPWTIQGRAVDERGQGVPQARVSVKSDSGKQVLQTDSWGRFSGQPAEQGQPTSLSLRVQAPHFDVWKGIVNLPLTQPVVARLTRKTATVTVSMYPYKWGEVEYRPISVVIYEYGNYHRRVSQTFSYNYGRCDAYLKYFPQGRPYRMTAVWADRRGYQHTLTRDGTITDAYQTFTLYNSWTY